MRLNNKKFALLLSEVSAFVYAVCSAFVALFPELSTKLMMSLFHISGGFNLGTRITLGGFVLGFLQVIAYVYIAGWIFSWIFNRAVNK